MRVGRDTVWLLAVAGMLAGLSPARAQNPNPRPATQVNSLPSSAFATLSNNYLTLQCRIPELAQTLQSTTTNGTTTTTNLGYSNYRGGRVLISVRNGDPFTTADNNANIVRGNWLVQSRVQLGGAITGGTGSTATATYEVESLYASVNNPNQDPFISTPKATSDSIIYSWQIRQATPGVTTITRAFDILTLATAGLVGSTSSPIAVVTQTYKLIRDMVRCEVAVQNVGTAAQTVGVETFIDPCFGGGSNADGNSFYVGTVQQPITREFMFPSVNSTDEAGLRVVPPNWRTYDNPTSPGVVLGGIWDNTDIETSADSVGAPKQTMFVTADLAGAMPFGYIPANVDLQGQDWGVLTRWTGVQISPSSLNSTTSQVKRFITYFGLSGASSDFSQPYALSVEAPYSLALANGDDPSTATQEPPTNVYRTPNPFKLRVFVNNVSTRALSNVAVSLALPTGFLMANSKDSITKTIATVPVGGEQEVNWDITSSSTQQAGVQTITVSSSGNGLNSKVIERTIGIPALPQLAFPAVTRRLDMISVPYDFQNRDLSNVLNSLGALGVTGGGNAAVARYNPSTRAYAFFPDTFITAINPGEAMWLFNGSLATLQLPSDRFQTAATSPVGVALTPDWNQVGCPYTVSTRLFDAQVVTSDNTTHTFTAAVNSGIVRPVLYEYSPDPTSPTNPGTYTFSGDSNTLFNPWRGYWIRVLQPITLVFNATNLIGPFRHNGPDYLGLHGGWQISLQGGVTGFGGQPVWLGQDPSGTEGYNSRDVELPPDVGGGSPVRLAVVHNDWGRDSGAYLRDIRGPGATTLRWQVDAASAAANQDVTLRWNLRGAPADVQFTLVDLQSGARRYMRTTSGYVYNTGSQGRSRSFQVIAERRSRPNLAITTMTATPTRGRQVGMTFNLSAPCLVDVLIESPGGRRVRTLATQMAAVEGQNSVGWDGRDDQQRPAPAGQYRCRVLAHTPDGQLTIAERIVILNR